MSREEDRFPCSVKTDTPVGSVEINGRVYRVALVVEELIQIQAARVSELEAWAKLVRDLVDPALLPEDSIFIPD